MSTPIKIAELERLDAAATAGPWRPMESGNQYLECGYLPTAKCVATARIPELPRPWNPHAVISFMKLDAAEESRFKSDDAALIGAARNALPALLRLARASDRYAWMLSKDGPGEDEEHVVVEIVAEWVAARAAFDFTNQEPSS